MTYYQCPECGFPQRSQAVKKIKCGRCQHQYDRRTAKTVEKKPDADAGTGFFQYSRKEE